MQLLPIQADYLGCYFALVVCSPILRWMISLLIFEYYSEQALTVKVGVECCQHSEMRSAIVSLRVAEQTAKAKCTPFQCTPPSYGQSTICTN